MTTILGAQLEILWADPAGRLSLLALLLAAVALLLAVLKGHGRGSSAGGPAADWEKSLASQDLNLAKAKEELAGLKEWRLKVTEGQKINLQGLGLVRFDAFPNMGGQLSFAWALLDAKGNGVVLTYIQGRDDCRTYIRSITGGRGTNLMAEEEEALRQAQAKLNG